MSSDSLSRPSASACSSDENPPTKQITIENASKCTPYELRQELNRRNAFDIPENQVNFRSMLQRLMVELVKEKEVEEKSKVEQQHQQLVDQRMQAKSERERKKAEALERSKQRTSDPNYFQQRQQTNTAKGAIIEVKTTAESDQSTTDTITEVHDNESTVEKEPEDGDKELDVFRSYQNKGRSKIFVK